MAAFDMACGHASGWEAVRQRLAHLSYDGFAYVLHVFGRHGSQCFNVLRDTGKVEDFGILGLAFQGVDHGGATVPDFLVALCAHYQCC